MRRFLPFGAYGEKQMDAHQAGLATKFVVPICLDLAGPVGFPVEALAHWLIKQPLFCKCQDDWAGQQASMFR